VLQGTGGDTDPFVTLTKQGTPRKHPIVEALAEAINKHKLSRTWFKRIIEKRVIV